MTRCKGDMAKLGEGGFGSVFAEGDKAVKTFKDLSPMVNEAFVTRYVSMSKCPQIITPRARSFNSLTLKTQRWHCSLRRAMSVIGMNLKQRRLVFRDVLLAVAHLESLHIVHADIKPSNVFVNATLDRAVLGDFGLSSCSGSAKVGWTTPEYAPKHHINHRTHDAFGLALLGLELLYAHNLDSGEYPDRVAIRSLVVRVVKDPGERQCFLGLLHQDPKKAWKASSLLQKMYGHSAPVTSPPIPKGYILGDQEWLCVSYHLERLASAYKFKRPNRCKECCESVISRLPEGNHTVIVYTSALAYIFACVFGYRVKTDKKDRMTAEQAANYACCSKQDIICAIDTTLSCKDAVVLMFTQ